MRTLIVFLLCLVFSPVFAGEGQEGHVFNPTGVYLKVGYLNWNETLDTRFIMRERTTLVTVGVEGTLPSRNASLPITWLLEATGGVTAYNGSDMLTQEPSKSTQLYAGVRAEITSHVRMVDTKNFVAGPFLGVGHTLFTKSAGPEIWNVLYTRLGVEVESSEVFANFGVVTPIFAVDHGLHANIGYEDGFYLPRGRASLFAELGAKLSAGTRISVSYDSMRLDSSPAIKSHQLFGTKKLAFFQPDTKAFTISLKVSYRFGRTK